MKDSLRIAAYVTVAVVIGSIREFLFVNLNYQIDHVRRSTPFSYAHSKFQHLVAGWELSGLVALKWTMAVSIALLILILTIRVSRIVFDSRKYDRFLLTGYGIAALLSLTLFVLSTWQTSLRLAAVQLLHALQFPIIMIMIILSSRLVKGKN